jgi:hypothetical protein
MKGGRTFLLGLVFFALASAGATLARAQRQDGFPHQRHARLFPFCSGCHVMEGARAAFYPQPQLCGRCHDGQQVERVTWAPPAAATNLRFDHAVHARETAAERPAVECAACHGRQGGGRMAVTEAEPTQCLSCHAHQATDHLANARCSTCHVALAQSSLSADAVAALPRPADHQQSGFLERHGQTAESGSCEFCHARQQCAACHVNAAAVPAITRLAQAPPALRVPVRAAKYPTPASHKARDFATYHAAAASSTSCAACHARESCMSCHTGRLPEAVSALTPRAQSAAQGVATERSGPLSHAAPSFSTEHGNAASADPGTCTMCHTTDSCASCHDSPREAVFHPADFMASHSNAAYTGRMECSNCHNAAVFCRNCHQQIGQTSRGRLLSTVFHDAEPLWLLRHGGAARRGLEGCTSCHRQRDCMQCHSTVGAFRVNPHGTDFDARRAQQKNPIICKVCHVVDPLIRE